MERIIIIASDTAIDLISHADEVYYKSKTWDRFYLTDDIEDVCERIRKAGNEAGICLHDGKYYVYTQSDRNLFY